MGSDSGLQAKGENLCRLRANIKSGAARYFVGLGTALWRFQEAGEATGTPAATATWFANILDKWLIRA